MRRGPELWAPGNSAAPRKLTRQGKSAEWVLWVAVVAVMTMVSTGEERDSSNLTPVFLMDVHDQPGWKLIAILRV